MQRDIEFEWVNAVDGGEGQRRHEELGKPIIPSLVIDGKAVPILQVTQIASALGLESPDVGDSRRLAWDMVPVLESWLELLPQANWDTLLSPTRSRSRSLRLLTVNVFHPFELLPHTWHHGTFPWFPGDPDLGRELPLTDLDKLLQYARERFHAWQSFLVETDEALSEHDPVVWTPRGEVAYSVVLAGQRWHVAWHHRQLVDHLQQSGFNVGVPLDVEVLAEDLELPDNIY